MDDLVKRLQEAYPATQDMQHTMLGDLMDEAAARIAELERERDALKEIAVRHVQGELDERARADRLAGLLKEAGEAVTLAEVRAILARLD